MVIASIDLMDGKAVQLKQGAEKVLEVENPLDLAKRFNRYGEVAVIDLDAALGNGNNKDVIKPILKAAECRVGGGIKTVEQAKEWISLGARKVIIGSKAFENDAVNHKFLQELADAVSPQHIIIAIDARNGEIVTKGWKHRTGLDLLDSVRDGGLDRSPGVRVVDVHPVELRSGEPGGCDGRLPIRTDVRHQVGPFRSRERLEHVPSGVADRLLLPFGPRRFPPDAAQSLGTLQRLDERADLFHAFLDRDVANLLTVFVGFLGRVRALERLPITLDPLENQVDQIVTGDPSQIERKLSVPDLMHQFQFGSVLLATSSSLKERS